MNRHLDISNLAYALEEAKQHHQHARFAVEHQEKQFLSATDYLRGRKSGSLLNLVENFTYTLQVLLHPQMHTGPSRVTVKGPLRGLPGQHVRGLPHVLRRCMAAGRYDNEMGKVIHDMICGWGVGEIRRINSRVDNRQETVVPMMKHIHPNDLLVLPDAMSWEECSTFFRRRIVSRAWLMDQARKDTLWDKRLVKGLLPPEHPTYNRWDNNDEVEFWEGWVRPATLDGLGLDEVPEANRDEFDGVRFWINNNGDPIRPFTHHFGLEGCPYEIFGATRSTSEIYPVGVAVAAGPNADGVETMIRHIERQVHRMQKLIFARTTDKALREIVENGKDGVYPVGHNVTKEDIWEVDLQGPRKDAYEFLNFRTDKLYEVSGMTDLMRGKMSQRASATEASLVNSSSNTRLDGLLYSKYKSEQRLVEQMAFYASVDRDVSMYLFGNAAEELNMDLPRWRGGLPDGVTYESLGLEVSVSDGHRTNPMLQSRKMLEGAQVATMLSDIKMRYPDSNIEELMGRLFESMQVPELRSLFFGDPAEEAGPANLQAPAQQDPNQALPQAAQGGPIGLIQ